MAMRVSYKRTQQLCCVLFESAKEARVFLTAAGAGLAVLP